MPDETLLRECAASGQLDASQIHQHLAAGELNPADFTTVQSNLHALEREIAIEAAVFDIETKAVLVAVHEGPLNVYDVSRLEPTIFHDAEIAAADMRAITRAAHYLGLVGMLYHTDPGKPHFVSIRSRA